MKRIVVYIFLLAILTCLQSCFLIFHKYKPDPNYVEPVLANGYIGTGIYNYDNDGVHAYSHARYKISEKTSNSMRYELLKAEYFHLNIYDTLSFYFNFEFPDSSSYVFSDSEYNSALKKYEFTVTNISLDYRERLTDIKDCKGCSIYKFESSYQNGCHTWFISDSIGFVKAYGPYHNDIADYEIDFMRGTPKDEYLMKLLMAIKTNKLIHTRCSSGTLW